MNAPLRQPILRQWALLLAGLALAILLAAGTGVFWREDLLLYDAGLAGGRAPEDILIVAVDEASLAQLGRWPWRRAVHAALLDRLRVAGARGVALDFVFSEPDPLYPADDASLAAAMRRGPPVVLPLVVDWQQRQAGLREIAPIAPLAQAAAGIAHVHLELDRDGIARGVFLREGIGRANRSHLALALLQALPGGGPLSLPGTRAPPGAGGREDWVRDYHVLIPFLGPPGHFHQVSYVDVLRGLVPASQLRDRLILVGATAQGLGDSYPTPRSGEGVAMPGVEITAQVLSALESGHTIREVSRGASIGLALLPLLLVFLGFLRLSPRQALALVAVVWCVTLGTSLLALRALNLWWPPSTALAALLLAYPLWSWRRLEAAQVYLDEELSRLDQEPLPLPAAAAPGPQPRVLSDALQARIDRVRDATARLRQLRQLLGDTIAAMPDAMLLVDTQGRIVLANPPAATLFAAASAHALGGQGIFAYIAPLVAGRYGDFDTLARQAPITIEARDGEGRDLMIRLAAFHDGSGRPAGTVVDIADVSQLKSAERERDDTIRFLSHDLRSPSSSLLGLAQVLRNADRAISPVETAQRIETLAGRTLALADGFIALARAQILAPRQFERLDLRDALQDGIDEVWAAAQARQVRITTETWPTPAQVLGDRQMLGRALTNLLTNAVKFSPPESFVRVTLDRGERGWCVSVTDSGPGIAKDRQGALFERFRRAVHAGESDPGGVGLGLAFVRVVAQKHGGSVQVQSDAGRGACFQLLLPLPDEPEPPLGAPEQPG